MGRKRAGGVEVRENSIRVSFQYQGERRRPTLMIGTTPMPPTPANIRHAHRLVAEINDRIRHGVFVMAEYFPVDGDKTPVTLADQFSTWLASQRIEESTRSGYSSAIMFWSTADIDGIPLGKMKLRQIVTSHLLKAIAARQDLSGKTINNYVSVIRDALELAVIDKLITDNPAMHVKRAPHQKPLPDPFEPWEREAIISMARERNHEQIWNLIEFWFWSGLRTSEVIALSWPQVLLPTSKVVIKEARVNGRLKDTKTNVEREVELNSRSMAALQRQRKHTQLAAAEVFHNPQTNERWDFDRRISRTMWHRLLSLNGIRHRRPYNMRHTYATAMLMAGMTPAFCAKQMGHSVQVFLSTYAKWIDGNQNAREMARLESSFVPTVSPDRTKAD